MWLSVMAGPDVASPLRACARHSLNLSPHHWKTFLKVATHVNVTKEIGFRFVRGSGLGLSVYHVDANYAVASNGRRSTSGVAVLLVDTATS